MFPSTPKLRALFAADNELTELDLSQNPALSELNVRNNALKALDLSHNKKLSQLLEQGNPMNGGKQRPVSEWQAK